MTPGHRVGTPHGPGEVVKAETARVSWPGEVPERRAKTGRYEVRLDTWPFAWKGDTACYWSKELTAL